MVTITENCQSSNIKFFTEHIVDSSTISVLQSKIQLENSRITKMLIQNYDIFVEVGLKLN